MILIILLYALCASMFTISKWGLAYSEPIFLVAIRMSLAGVLLGGYFLWAEKRVEISKMWVSVKQDWFLFLQIIFFHIYLTYICDLCALKNISSIESAVIYNLSPFFAALFSYFWFGEYMTGKKWFGLILGFSSMLYGLSIPEVSANIFRISTPRLLTLLAVISSSYGWIVLRDLVKKGYSPIFINGFGMFIGGIIALATSYFSETWTPSPVTEWYRFFQAVILLIVVANIAFYNLYGYLLKTYTATFLSFAGFLCPFFASIFGVLFLGETFPRHLLPSFVFLFIGLIIFYHEELRQGYIKNS